MSVAVAGRPWLEAASAMDTGSGGGNGIVVVAVVLGLLIIVSVPVPFIRAARARRIVRDASRALAGLEELNGRYVAAVMPLPVLQLAFRHAANSKSTFDRFDLRAFMATCVLERETWVFDEIAARRQRVQQYSAYTRELTSLGEQSIGRSADDRLEPTRFLKIEQHLFQGNVLAPPTPLARIIATATYTSPKGQNEYSSRLEWNFDQLEAGFVEAQDARAHRSTATYLRQRERNLMTPKLRTDVLRRDRSRCRMCGASAADGANLHIDHIVPVSHGGRTLPDNLQTLCQSCNLGKSNRFVG